MSSGSSADLDAKLNKPLGVLIDEEASARRGRGRGRGRGGSGNGSGPARRGRPISQAARANGSARSSSYQQTETRTRSSTGSANSSTNSSSSSNAAGRVVGDTIFVSNLSKDITAEDVTDIFSRVGAVKNASVNYNQNGESQGTAEVTFQRKDDAETAVKEYDQAEVEGRVMYVKLVAQFVKAPNVVRRPQNIVQRPAGRAAPRVDTRRSQQTRGGGGGGGSRGARGGRGGRGRGRGGRNGAKPTKEELDADLDNIKSGASAGQPASHSDA